VVRVPFQDLAAAHARTAVKTEAAVLEVLRSGQYVGGPRVEALEAAIAARMGRRFGVGVSCGTEAIILSLQAAGVRPGDEVILPAVSFFATLGAVIHSGAVPVVVDVLPDRPLMDPELAARAITPRTRAIVPVHLFGDVAPEVAGATIVDDAAQAIGIPTKGAFATLSFYPTKVLAGAGEGGMILVDDPAQRDALRLLRNHGMARAHEPERVDGVVGKNARMDAIQAVVLLARLDDLDASIATRRAIASRYDVAFGALALRRSPASPISSYVIRHPARDRLRAALARHGIDTQVYYPRPLSAFVGARAPQAERFCAECLAIPCHATLTTAQVDHVIAAVAEEV
jgi:dTDP-4-amino-4,6-dideoxygalactose transaminase